MMHYVSEFNKIKEKMGNKPEKVYRYYVYSKGFLEIDTFDKEVANLGNLTINGVIECILYNEDEIQNYNATYSELVDDLFNRWYAELRKEYSYLPNKVFDLVYHKSCEAGQSYGYDEISNCMIDFAKFAEDIIEVYPDC
jgi:hypothetical protein